MSTDRLTEVLNYLSAMSREVGEFRSETKTRFAALETRLGSLEMEVRKGFEQVRADIRKINHKLDVTAQDMLDLRGNQLGLERRVEVLEKKSGITDTA